MLTSGFDMNELLFRGIAFLIAITVHELGHAFVAYRLGDPTPKVQGRLTLNPIAHMDVLGTLMILFTPLGWAKPVQFNPYNFKGNRRVGMILTTLAGPLANLLTAILFGLLFTLLFHNNLITGDVWQDFFIRLINAVVQLNVLLFLFNLLPIPPLDGYWIVRGLLPLRVAHRLTPLEMYGPFILLLVVVLGGTTFLLGPVFVEVMNFVRFVTGN